MNSYSLKAPLSYKKSYEFAKVVLWILTLNLLQLKWIQLNKFELLYNIQVFKNISSNSPNFNIFLDNILSGEVLLLNMFQYLT